MFSKKARQNDPVAGSSRLRGQPAQVVYPSHAEPNTTLASSAQFQQQHQYTSYASRTTLTALPTVLKDAVSHSHSSTPPRDIAPPDGPAMSSSLQDQQVKDLLQSLPAFTPVPNPSLSAAYLTSANSKRASIQSITSRSSAVTAATSRSSFERPSSDYHRTGETSTLASSQAPPSTESLGLAKPSSPDENQPQDVPISGIQPSWQRRASQEAMYDRAAGSSTKPTTSQRAVSSAAAPTSAIVNSDYESSSRTRALRRMKGQSLGPTRGATSTSDASLPAPRKGEPVSGSALSRSQSSKQTDREMMRPSLLGSHSRRPSGESQSTRSGHIPEVQSPSMTAQPSIVHSLSALGSSQRASTNGNQRSATSSSTAYLHPQLVKLKETSIPQLASPVLSSAGSSRWSGLQSPRSSTLMSDRTSWLPPTSSISRSAHVSSSSATLYSIPQDSPAPTTLMTSSTSSRASRVDPPVDPSKVYHPIIPSAPPALGSPASTYVTALAETIVGSQTPGSSNASTAIGRPQSPVSRPGSAQVQAIFSPASIASRLPTPHPLRGSGLPKQLSQTISSGITPISTPPPLPPSSTRPDVAASPTKPAPMAKQASLREMMMERLKSTTSPSPGSVISPSFTMTPGSLKRTSASAGQTQPQNPVLRSYGLEKSSSMVPQPPAPQRRISREYPQSEYGDSEPEHEEHEEYDVVQSTQVVQVTTKTVRRGSRTITSPVPVTDYAIPSPAISTHDVRKSVYSSPSQTPQTPTSATSSKGHGILDMFRSKSPHQRSSTVPPSLQSSNSSFHNLRGASPSPRPRTPGNGSRMSLPFRLFGHRPTKSTVSDLSVQAVVETDRDGAMSSCSSLLHTASEVGAVGPPSPPMRDPIEAVLHWQGSQVEGFKQTGRTKQRTPGVTWDLPPGHHEPSGEEGGQQKRKMPLMRRSRRAQMTMTEGDDL